MSDKVQRAFGYSRVVALLTLISSALWFVAAVVRSFPEFVREPDHLGLVLPFLYWLAITSIAVWTLARPPEHIIRHAVRGVLAGALVAYISIATMYLRQPDQWGDGEFELGVLFVSFLYAGLFFGLVGALFHAVAAVFISMISISD